MRRAALTLVLSLLLVLNPGVVFPADAAPGRARVDRAGVTLKERPADGLGLPEAASGDAVWYGEATVPHRAGVAGVTWTSDNAPRAVYLREVDGTTFGAWRELDVEPANPSEPGNGKGGTDPYVIAGAKRVQVAAVSNGTLRAGLNVYASSETSETTTVGVTKAEAADVKYAWSDPQILARSEWGADESLVKNPYTYAQVTGAMIHHTAGSNSYTQADVPAILRSIQAYHVNDRGWNDIAYNFLIDKFGRAWEGRGGGVDKAVQGGHAWGVTNARTTGVSLIGNFETASPPSVMLDTTERVIAWKFALHGVDPYGSTYGSGGQDGGSTYLDAISGHRDENATDCPGQYVYSQMAAIRSKVAAYIPQYKGGSSTPTTTPTTGASNLARTSGVTVTASSQDASTASTAAKAVDGVVSGYPSDESKEWTTLGGKANSWIELAFPSAVTVDKVVLYDRINTVDQITGGRLTFSDGSTVTVGSLNNAGGATTVTFTARTVTSVRFTVTSVSSGTENTGLAEFEVWGTPSGTTTAPPANRAPSADAGPDQSVVLGATVTLAGSGSDPDAGTTLTYAWTQKAGPAVTLSSKTQPKPTFVAAAAGSYVFELTVSDGTLSATDSVTIKASGPTEGNLARNSGVQVTASSQSTGQEAVKAIDGSTLGYPADYTREWATQGGKAGSWIQLKFPSAVSVSKVVLYDRPNSDDRITGGTLLFSDGTTVPVTSLTNAGGATTFTFPARTTTSVRLTVTSVSAATRNIGLAEMEVWGFAG